MKNAILSTLNYRILIILVETLVIFFVYKTYQVNVEVDFFIFSIAIVFPLVFSITSAYQRRQDSIIEFSKFRNKIIDVSNLMYAVNGFKKEDYNKIFNVLLNIQEEFLNYMINGNDPEIYDQIRQKRKDLFKEIVSYKELFNEREKDSIIGVKNEMFLSMEKLNGIKLHNTPISLRRYCLIFIYISPLLFNTKLISENQFQIYLGIDIPVSVFFSMLISFILMALYNIQDYIENPFDQKGLDDLKINALKISNRENLYE
jgi:predicted membrane chloride channel (bestrophin family)